VARAVEAGAADAEFLKTDPQILEAKTQFGATPTLFERGTARRAPNSQVDDDEAALQARKPQKENKTAERKKNPE